MSDRWHVWKLWRLARTIPLNRIQPVRDGSGNRWVPIAGTRFYWRVSKRPVRRAILRWARQRCPHREMKADMMEGDGPKFCQWCPDCGMIRIGYRDPSNSWIGERVPGAKTEHSQWD